MAIVMNASRNSNNTNGIYDVLMSLLFDYPLSIMKGIRRTHHFFAQRSTSNQKRRRLRILFLLEIVLVMGKLAFQRSALQVLQDAFFCTPVGGAVELVCQFVPYLIKQLSDPGQVFEDAATVNYAMHNIPQYLSQHSLWLTSCGQFFGLAFIAEDAKSAGFGRIMQFIHGLFYSLAYGVLASALVNLILGPDGGRLVVLFSSWKNGVGWMLLCALAVIVIYTLLMLHLYILFSSLWEMLIVAAYALIWAIGLGLIALVVSFVLNRAAAVSFLHTITAAGFVTSITQNQAVIGLGIVAFMISYAYMHTKHAFILDMEPEQGVKAWKAYFRGNDK